MKELNRDELLRVLGGDTILRNPWGSTEPGNPIGEEDAQRNPWGSLEPGGNG